jgi:hypothetical protein
MHVLPHRNRPLDSATERHRTTDSEKGRNAWRAIVSVLIWLKIGFVKVMHLDKRTGEEIRNAEKDRQKGIRREIRGLSNQPDGTGDPRPDDEKGG